MALSTQPYKGARDFYPADKQLQNYMFGVMRLVAERFGYQEYDAPILEPLELYQAKTGEEIVNEQTYVLTDRGDRRVVIRPEMTPSVSRMVAARRQELSYPVRWYSIPNLWRYERPQRGRLREHWQLNVDLFGVAGLEGDQEIILVADAIMQQFGAKRADYQIKLNSRRLTQYLFEHVLKLGDQQAHDLGKLVDKMHKISSQDFTDAVHEIITSSQTAKDLLEILRCQTLADLPAQLQTHESVAQLTALLKLLEGAGVTNAAFDITLMRGFDYYTDIVFEVYDTDPNNNRSMFGGGRYDGLVGLFGVEPVPTVGFGMGDVTLQNFLESHQLLPDLPNPVDLQVVLVGQVYGAAQPLLQSLRDTYGLNVAVDLTDRKIDKQLKAAHKAGARFVLFVGEQELRKDLFKLKDLRNGQEEDYTVAQVAQRLKANQ